MSRDAVYQKADWPLLRQQKDTLNRMIAFLETSEDSKDIDHLDGLIHFLDSIQDDAAELGYPVYRD